MQVLISAPFGRDAESLASLLGDKGYRTLNCPTPQTLADHIDTDTGAVLVTEEALVGDMHALRQVLDAQPAWSDLPFILLATRQSGRLGDTERVRKRLPESASNVILIERPLSAVSLLSAVASAIRSRVKQLLIRDQLAELAESRRALQTSERELRLVADSLPVLIAFIDTDLRYRFANRAYEYWFYRSPEEIVGCHVSELFSPQDLAVRLPVMQAALAGEPARLQRQWPHQDGSRRDADIRYLPRRTPTGEVDGFHVFVLDITDSKKVEEGLRDTADTLEAKVAERTAELSSEMHNRAQAEAALRQSQKMEAVGQLTGGIAHDFNNMLTGIIGAMDIMKRRLAAGRVDDLPRFMDAAATSANRAAGLTQRLLAFSRRQSLDAKALDVRELLHSLEELIRRTLHERISLHTAYGANLPPVIADANQLESAVLNLAINARDAMPFGGQLTLETTQEVHVADTPTARPNLASGTYIVISLSDSGAGMTPQVLEKVFDPFFTTKPVGQGTGLGLSMVYGFARQSHGDVVILSQPGVGTTVRLYLPTANGPAEPLAREQPASPSGRGQRILLVEDDATVRLLVRDVLTELGYDTLDAAEPGVAIEHLGSNVAIDLLISDVGLPGMNGRQLAEIARQHRPDLPVLFITGYAENAAIRASFLGANMDMITKPFSMADLASKVGEMLPAPQ
ncbi:MAG: response regulator [Gammaproteobacteria bacterium]|nr:response regulator [Gammaproteobacteria bacterium]MBU1491442.1 response regulator [Gammaproteobacteria bacterium]MBU2216409.1 response regulator [Gammaproteobacteria bacterium]MBU2323347.1 response regulator [Gammaproteobacteria bacterium]